MAASAVNLVEVERTFAGQPPTRALRGLDLAIDQGEYVAIVGPSGSGKSTLVNVISLLDRPSSGEYYLNGTATTTLNERQRTRIRADQVGIVFQDFKLLQWRSALANVALANLYHGISKRRRLQQAEDALNTVGMGHQIHAYPATMSGGERQRVAIARALASQPTILLCDEPTGSLDSANTEIILNLLSELHELRVTILVVTHDELVAARAPRRVTVKDGRVVADEASTMGAER